MNIAKPHLYKIKLHKIEEDKSVTTGGMPCRQVLGYCLTYVALAVQFAAMETALAQRVTVEETQIESTQTSSAPMAQVPAPATVLGKDEINSLSKRLEAMQEQIDMGTQKQWLSPDDAATLKTKADTLVSQAAGLRTSYDKTRAAQLEQQSNELNTAISDAMKNAPAAAQQSNF